MKEENFHFEKAFARLEEILDKMNSGGITLDESLHLYEEADHLIHTCNKRLNSAEQKIEMLIKKRDGELELVTEGNLEPRTQSFQPQKL